MKRVFAEPSFAALAVILASPLAAQFQFATSEASTVPGELPAPSLSCFADVDGDHDLDLLFTAATYDVATSRSAAILGVCRNDGSGRFGAPSTTVVVPEGSGSLVLTAIGAEDLDGDGDVDVVIGRSLTLVTGGRTLLLLNDGSGRYTASAGLPDDDNQGCAGLVLFDCDGDRDLDLFLCGARAFVGSTMERLCINDGAGTFVFSMRALPQDGTTTTEPIAADVDGDGDVDLCMIRGMTALPPTGGSALWLNDGLGGFTDVTAMQVPTNFGLGATAQVFLDADGDHDVDLAVSSPGGTPFATRERLASNDGTGHFAASAVEPFPSPARGGTTRLSPFDADGDGDLDLFVARIDPADTNLLLAAPDALWVNDGQARFRDATAEFLPPISTSPLGVSLGDLDADGDTDVLVRGGSRFQVYRNEVGWFEDASRHRIPDELRGGLSDVAVVDVDRDGDLDLLGLRVADMALLVAANDGDGRFSSVGRVAAPARRLVDFDADGDRDPDLVFLVDGQNRLYLNDGSGAFTDATNGHLPVATGRTVAILPIDFDGDGDLDLVQTDETASTFALTLTVLRNDGAGVFTIASGILPSGFDAMPSHAFDFDRDGHVDMLAASPRLQVGIFAPVLLHNLGGGFGVVGELAFPVLAVRESIQHFATGDVDGDGDVDILLGASEPPAPGYGQNHLFLGRGDGSFFDATSSRLPVLLTSTTGLALVDVDEDGDLDIADVSSNGDRVPFELQLNDGTGTFVRAATARVAEPQVLYGELLVGDLDGDLDLDLVTGGPRITIDRHRQIGVARPALLGGVLALTVQVEPGYGLVDRDVWIWYSAARAVPPIDLEPFGSFRLALSTIVYERRLVTTAGTLQHVLAVPTTPALYGLTMAVQAAVFHGPDPLDARFTNAITERIGR